MKTFQFNQSMRLDIQIAMTLITTILKAFFAISSKGRLGALLRSHITNAELHEYSSYVVISSFLCGETFPHILSITHKDILKN